VARAAGHLRGGETVLVRNADFLSDVDLSDVTAAHLASGSIVTLVLMPHRRGYTPVDVDAQGRVLSFGGRPPVDPRLVAHRCMFSGFQLLEEEIFDLIPPDTPCDLVRDVYAKLVEDRRIHSFLHSGFWWEFGTPLDYLEGSLQLIAMNGRDRMRVAKTDPVQRVGRATVAVGTGADFHTGVDLRGGVALGMACLVAEGTRIEDSVIMPEAWIGPGSDLRRAVVGPGTEVPAGTVLEDVLVCADPDPDAPVPAGTDRVGGLLVRPLAVRSALPGPPAGTIA
jgi:NDP-sugar pyrophosphorylase family protein